MIEAEQLHARILDELDLSKEVEDEELTRIIYRVLREAESREYLPLNVKTALGRELFNAFRKLDLLEEFLEDDEITEVMINGTQNIFYEKKGRIFQSDKRFLSKEKLEDVIQQIVAGANRLVNEASPIVDARLADGSRVNVVLAPIALNGPIVTIRKFPTESITMKQLIAWNSISEEVAEFLALLVESGYNIFISGGTGSGKTTVVRKIIESLPTGEVVLLPQDSYYKDSSHVPVEERQNINFDHPDAFEWSLLSKHIMLLKEGKSIEQPTYSYLTCTRQPETIHIEPREVVIIEGILALCDKKLRNMMDLKIFVDADPDERLIRVIQRDVIERGRTAEAVMERYTRVLKPMHLQFIEPCKRYADLIVPEGGSNRVAIDILTMYIKKHLKN